MSPKAERAVSLRKQIADWYRARILSGELVRGQQIPSVVDLMAEWGVGRQTAKDAISQLQVEGVVWTSPNGTFVAGNEDITTSPRERLRISRTMEAAEDITVTGAGIVTPPVYVSELLGIEPGEQVIRREEVTSRGRRPIRLTVDWVAGVDAVEAADLLKALPVEGGILAHVERATGRRAAYGQDHLRGRASDAREAGHLDLPTGAPILAVVSLWSDDDGVVVYEECCIPPDLTYLYDYELGEDGH
jgi:GntR family transcriptional regulator